MEPPGSLASAVMVKEAGALKLALFAGAVMETVGGSLVTSVAPSIHSGPLVSVPAEVPVLLAVVVPVPSFKP